MKYNYLYLSLYIYKRLSGRSRAEQFKKKKTCTSKHMHYYVSFFYFISQE